MNARIKVKVESLIEAIEARRAEAVAAFKPDDYAERLAEWQEKSRKALANAEKSIAKGSTPYSIHFDSAPLKGQSKLDTSKWDRDLATLRMAAEPTVSITAEDYARYIR